LALLACAPTYLSACAGAIELRQNKNKIMAKKAKKQPAPPTEQEIEQERLSVAFEHQYAGRQAEPAMMTACREQQQYDNWLADVGELIAVSHQRAYAWG
jgi:hypothetical protein